MSDERMVTLLSGRQMLLVVFSQIYQTLEWLAENNPDGLATLRRIAEDPAAVLDEDSAVWLLSIGMIMDYSRTPDPRLFTATLPTDFGEVFIRYIKVDETNMRVSLLPIVTPR